jgi:hypothetical protein
MKKHTAVLLIALTVGGCISSKSTSAPGDISTRRIALVADFSGVYSNYGVDADTRQQLSMLEVLWRHSSPDLHTCDSVEISIRNGDTILFCGKKNGELSSTALRYFHKEEYSLSDSVVDFRPMTSTTSGEWEGSHTTTYTERFWLNHDGDLIIEESNHSSGLGLGVVPAAQWQKNVYRYVRKKG